jgi:hypothetical protein
MVLDRRKMKHQLEVMIRGVEKRLSESRSLELKCMAVEFLDRQVSQSD